MRRRHVRIALLALVLPVLLGPAGSAAARPGRAQSPQAPPTRFGYSYGPGADAPLDQQQANLAAIRSVLGANGFLRSPVHWNALARSEPIWSKYDEYLDRVRAHGLRWIPVIFESTGDHSFVTPQATPFGLAGWSAAVRDMVARYGPGGSYAAAHPGFPGITTFEVWNEPNTSTGNADPACPSCTMRPAVADAIMQTASAAIRSQAAAMHFRPEVIGFGIGSVDLAYLPRLVAADPHVMSAMDALSIHLYMRQAPATCPTGAGRLAVYCVRSLGPLRQWLDSVSPAGHAPAIAITEGGYAGSNAACRPPNVVSEADQAAWGAQAVAWIQAHPWLRVSLYSPFQPLDAGPAAPDCSTRWNPAFFKQSLGAVRADGTLKPWGLDYRAIAGRHVPPIR
jgi:hypothetical protein